MMRRKKNLKTQKRSKCVYDETHGSDADLSINGGDDGTTTSDDDRIIYFTGDVTESSVSVAVSTIFSLTQKNPSKPIYLVIETYGGSVDSMFALYDAIKYTTCPVHTIALGKVMSAGVLILAAGEKGHRLIAPHARVMTHPAWTVMAGNIFEIKHELKELKRQEELWEEAMARETGRPIKMVRELNSRHLDQYMTPKECIDFGIADDFLYKLPQTQKKTRAKRKKRP